MHIWQKVYLCIYSILISEYEKYRYNILYNGILAAAAVVPFMYTQQTTNTHLKTKFLFTRTYSNDDNMLITNKIEPSPFTRDTLNKDNT